MQEEIKKLLSNLKNGRTTSQEFEKLERWFDESSENGEWIWSEEEKNAVKNRIKKRVDEAVVENKEFNYRVILKIAASVLLMCTLFSLLYLKRNSLRNFVDPVIYAEAKTKAGQRLQIYLSDGTSVTLNGNSAIRYPKKFNRETRCVELLTGEAYFDVVHNATKPFLVKSGDLLTTVLGTAFNIKSYPLYNEISVAVTRGKVAVRNQDRAHEKEKTFFLLPGDQATLDKTNNSLKKTKADLRNVDAWLKGELSFDNESLRKVAYAFEYCYGIHFSFPEDIGDIRFSATFNEKDRLEDIIYAISKANKLKFHIDGNKVFFARKPIKKLNDKTMEK